MSREIKFRAWDERKEIMHYDFEFIRSGIEGNDWIVYKSDKQPLDSKPHPFENPHFSQQLKIMQFTGLKDKNNNPIYEGEIIFNDDRKENAIVKWSDKKAMWICEYVETKDSFPLWESISNLYYSIGNIHQHPHLLNQ